MDDIKLALLGDHEAAQRLTEAGVLLMQGDVPGIELFARERIPGWDCWGDEVC